MTLVYRLLRLLGAPSLCQRAQHLARDSYSQVRYLVEGRVGQMTPAEARGYMRARATPVLVAALRSQAKLSSQSERRLLAIAGDLLIDLLAADLAAVTARTRRKAA